MPQHGQLESLRLDGSCSPSGAPLNSSTGSTLISSPSLPLLIWPLPWVFSSSSDSPLRWPIFSSFRPPSLLPPTLLYLPSLCKRFNRHLEAVLTAVVALPLPLLRLLDDALLPMDLDAPLAEMLNKGLFRFNINTKGHFCYFYASSPVLRFSGR